MAWGNPGHTWRTVLSEGTSGGGQAKLSSPSPLLSSAMRDGDSRPTARKGQNDGACAAQCPLWPSSGCRSRVQDACHVQPSSCISSYPVDPSSCSLGSSPLCLPHLVPAYLSSFVSLHYTFMSCPQWSWLTLTCSFSLNLGSFFFRKFLWCFCLAGSLQGPWGLRMAVYLPSLQFHCSAVPGGWFITSLRSVSTCLCVAGMRTCHGSEHQKGLRARWVPQEADSGTSLAVKEVCDGSALGNCLCGREGKGAGSELCFPKL